MVTPTKDRQDMQRLIRLIFDTPIDDPHKKGLKELGDVSSLEGLKKQNTDVKTRILVAQALQACNGDIKSADFLMKYGGLEPVKESQVSLETPVFIDDLDDDSPIEVVQEDEDADPDNIIEDAILYNDPKESV
jgi:hypothetical protein